jgi:hypothetical protein
MICSLSLAEGHVIIEYMICLKVPTISAGVHRPWPPAQIHLPHRQTLNSAGGSQTLVWPIRVSLGDLGNCGVASFGGGGTEVHCLL